eukprot:3058909-Pleurochrysis_carterae.AAC.2
MRARRPSRVVGEGLRPPLSFRNSAESAALRLKLQSQQGSGKFDKTCMQIACNQSPTRAYTVRVSSVWAQHIEDWGHKTSLMIRARFDHLLRAYSPPMLRNGLDQPLQIAFCRHVDPKLHVASASTAFKRIQTHSRSIPVVSK